MATSPTGCSCETPRWRVSELKDSGSRQFDVLVVDAFTGDSIPVHLLTNNQAFLDQDAIRNAAHPWPKASKTVIWTDDYASLFAVTKY